MCMHALGINSQFCLGDRFWQSYVCQFGPPRGTIFGKGGPPLARGQGGDHFWQPKLVRRDRFWQFFAKIGPGGQQRNKNVHKFHMCSPSSSLSSVLLALLGRWVPRQGRDFVEEGCVISISSGCCLQGCVVSPRVSRNLFCSLSSRRITSPRRGRDFVEGDSVISISSGCCLLGCIQGCVVSPRVSRDLFCSLSSRRIELVRRFLRNITSPKNKGTVYRKQR